MIVPNLKGGLCNQLFQIAAAHAHAKRCSTFCGINYDLKHNCIQGHPPTKYRDTLYKNILVTDGEPSEKYSEPRFEYTPIPRKKDLLIDGYFQSEKYFIEFKDEIKNLFTFPDDIVQKVDNKFTDIPKKKIGVHIRRGDYKMFPNTHPAQTTEYYDRALRHFSLERTAGNCVFILCTDDFPSVQAEFDLNKYALKNPFFDPSKQSDEHQK